MSTNLKVAVSHIMTKDLHCVALQHTLKDVDALMQKYAIRHVPVISGDQLVGIISKSDLVKVPNTQGVSHYTSQKYHLEQWTAEQVMTKNVYSVQHDDSIQDAAEILVLCSFHAVPVLKGETLVGMVTTTDMIRYLLKNIE